MNLTINCHNPAVVEATKLGEDRDFDRGTLIFMGPEKSGLHSVTVFMPHAVAVAMAEAFAREMAAHEDRMAEAERAWEDRQARLMETGGPDDSAYRQAMQDAGRGHLLK